MSVIQKQKLDEFYKSHEWKETVNRFDNHFWLPKLLNTDNFQRQVKASSPWQGWHRQQYVRSTQKRIFSHLVWGLCQWMRTSKPYKGRRNSWSSVIDIAKACSCDTAASSFSHTSRTITQYTAFLMALGFLLLYVFLGLVRNLLWFTWTVFGPEPAFWTVPGLGIVLSSLFTSAALPNCGLRETRLSVEPLRDKVDVVVVLSALRRLANWSKPLGAGPSWKSGLTFANKEESVFCLMSLRWAPCESKVFVSRKALCMLALLFSSRRTKLFWAFLRSLSSPSIWPTILSTRIFTELRIYTWKDISKEV